MTYIENLGIARTVNSGIFRHIQGHLAIFSYTQTHWGILRYIQAFVGLLDHIQTYTTLAYTTVPHSKLSYNCIVTHIKNPHIYENSLNLCNPENLESEHIWNPETYSEPSQKFKMECFAKIVSYNYFSKTIYLRFLTGFWIHLWISLNKYLSNCRVTLGYNIV